MLPLSSTEAKVIDYLYRCAEETRYAAEIARELKIKRRTIYDTLDSLEEKGIVEKRLRGRLKFYKLTDKWMEVAKAAKISLAETDEARLILPPEMGGIEISLGDHILFFVGTSDIRFVKFLSNFLLAKLENEAKKEKCIIDIWHEEAQIKRELLDSLSGHFELGSNLDILYRGGVNDPTIRAGRIDPEGIDSTYEALMRKAEAERFDIVRAISISAGRIMSTVSNPEDFLGREEWGTRLIAGKKVIWLCVYQITDLERIENEEKRKRLFRDAILAHNKTIVLGSDGKIYGGEEAIRSLISADMFI